MVKNILNSVLAGISIGLGGLSYLMSPQPVVGAALFAVGLFIIVTWQLALFTGQVCRLPYRWSQLELTWLGNLAGTGIVAGLLLLTRSGQALQTRAATLFQIKSGDHLVSLLILGWLCNLCIFLAVDGFQRIQNTLGKYLAIWLGVMVFVLSGLEHCVADMFYWWLAGYPISGWRVLLVVTLGNILGGASCALIEKYRR